MRQQRVARSAVVLLLGLGSVASVGAEEPGPRLTLIQPAGGRVGETFEARVGGTGLEGLKGLICDDPRIVATHAGGDRFLVTIAKDVPPGLYDVRAWGERGLSAPRSIFATPRETTESVESAEPRPLDLDVSVSGVIEAPGDVDSYRFRVRAGQRVVVECWAERLDSKLRAVLELEDDQGRRLASNRGHVGLDPRLDHVATADGELVVRVHDLVYAGGAEHVYRLDVDSGPRADFAWPNVVRAGRPAVTTLFGRNLGSGGGANGFDQVVTTLSPSPIPPTRLFARPARFSVEEFAHDLPGGVGPVAIGLSDVDVALDAGGNHRPASAQFLEWPVEVGGRLTAGDESDWYRIRARRGEVLWIELFGERIGSPVDLEAAIFDTDGSRELLHLADTLDENGTDAVATDHSDPCGRWVAPADGDFLILVRNAIGGSDRDPRRLYRMSLRREEPDFRLLAVPGGGSDPGVLNVGRGGRGLIELVALRRRGFTGPIRVTADGAPAGLEIPDVWFGPGVDRAPMVVSADRDGGPGVFGLSLTGRAEVGGIELVRPVRGATTIPSGSPTASSRLTGRLAVGVFPDGLWRLTASVGRTSASQGSAVDVAVEVETREGVKAGAVVLTATGAPAARDDRTGEIAAGSAKGWYSFQAPGRLPAGPYTFVVRGETTLTLPPAKPGGKPTTVQAVAYSNPVTIEVAPGAFDLRLDPGNPPKIKRGQIVQIRYKAVRRNGFIGKIHTELTAPDGVRGLRGRGVTFVGQTDAGSIQVVASEDSPLGRQRFLRLEGVGTVEDEPIHHAACDLDLEIVD